MILKSKYIFWIEVLIYNRRKWKSIKYFVWTLSTHLDVDKNFFLYQRMLKYLHFIDMQNQCLFILFCNVFCYEFLSFLVSKSLLSSGPLFIMDAQEPMMMDKTKGTSASIHTHPYTLSLHIHIYTQKTSACKCKIHIANQQGKAS